jgi:leucyl aminopeptidase
VFYDELMIKKQKAMRAKQGKTGSSSMGLKKSKVAVLPRKIMVDEIPSYLDSIFYVKGVFSSKKRSSLEDCHRRKLVLISSSQKAQWIEKLQEEIPQKDRKKFCSGQWSHWSYIEKGGISVVLLSPPPVGPQFSHYGYLEESPFVFWKSQGAAFFQKENLLGTKALFLESDGLDSDQWLGFLLGLELGCYQYSKVHQSSFGRSSLKKLSHQRDQEQSSHAQDSSDSSFLEGLCCFYIDDIQKTEGLSLRVIEEAQAWGVGHNLSRHLVNLPPSECYPQVVAEYVRHYFRKLKGVQVSVLSEKELSRERMGLLLGVGQGSQYPPCFVKIEYKSSQYKSFQNKSSSKQSLNQSQHQHLSQHQNLNLVGPIALVGKGVTFDTGGLDIKPSSGMRLMKKDMAGAAAVIGSLFYCAKAQLPLWVTGHLPLAENAVDSRSMRPSDVLKARSGLSVEIHNTDAEGRLILADALDYALTSSSKKEKPSCVIDVATLTGAIKTTLGLEIGGLFSNDDILAEALLSSAQFSGDLAWRIPLYSSYAKSFSTPFADLVNAVDGWASPITAALFLERFVQRVPWVHLDIYGWSDKIHSTQVHPGGNAQGVGLLNSFLRAQR